MASAGSAQKVLRNIIKTNTNPLKQKDMKIKKILNIILFACIVSLISCDNKEIKEQLFLKLKNADGSVVQTLLKIDAAQISKSLLVNSNSSWILRTSASWITATPSSGKNDATVRIDFQQNESLQARTAQIDALLDGQTAASIDVEQYGTAARLSVMPSVQDDLSAEGGDILFSIDANAEWTCLLAGGNWLTETERTPRTLKLAVSPNDAAVSRMATLTFKLADYSNTVEVSLTQKPGAVADLLDVVFKNDGTAEDASPMRNVVTTLESPALFTFYSDAYERFGAVFNHAPGAGITDGYYKVDYAGNQAFKDKLADGHSIEMLVAFDDDMPQNREIKPLSSMEAGGTGLMIGSDNQLTFLPNISASGASSWQWTRSGVVPERGRYYHVVGVWNRAQQKSCIYVNGEMKNRVDAIGNFNFPNAIDKYWFGIGADAGASGQAAWRGKIMIARIYDDPLSDSEVTTLWSRVNKPQPPAGGIVLENISFVSGQKVIQGGSFIIMASGFRSGDKVRLTSLADDSRTYLCDGTATSARLQIALPDNLTSGRYRLTIVRGEQHLDIGFVTWEVVPELPAVNAQVIAHRGYWNTAGSAQNSIASLRKAQELGVYGSEFDVWITTDGVVVLNHDATISGIRIDAVTYDQLKNITLSNGEKMPLLEDYFEQGKKYPSTRLVLEIKTHSSTEKNNAVVAAVVNKVRNAGMTDQVEYIAFDFNICRKLIELQPDAVVAYLNGDKSPQALKDVGINGIDYTQSVLTAHPEWVAQAHQLNMTVNVWTVNSEADLVKVINLGVDYITTDNPVAAQQIIAMMKTSEVPANP
jgi:glycerophosphoryl diester phosphodiesterase